MRLICENCDAQYEVDADMVPPEGRDVQCSACGHIWFQAPEAAAVVVPLAFGAPQRTEADELADLMEAELQAAPDARFDRIAAAAEEAAVASGAHVVPRPVSSLRAAPPLPELEPEEDLPPLPDGDESDLPPLRRPKLDDDMMALLREEAERETAARALEAQHNPREFEHQPDLGLDEASPGLRLQPSRPRPAPAEDLDEAIILPVEPEGERLSRRDLLPDIEQINSTLDGMPAADYMAGEAMNSAPRRGGFARGFAVALILWAIAVLVYTQAPQLREALPGTGPALESYVDFVTNLRGRLDHLVGGLL